MRLSVSRIMLALASLIGGHAVEIPNRRPKPISEPLVPEGPGRVRSAPYCGRLRRRPTKHLAPSRAWHVCRKGL